MSSEKIVITIKGESLPISQCREFNKQWYKIGNNNEENSGDCYLINGRYLREETGAIVFNHSVNEYTNKSDSIANGVVEIIGENVKFGYFNYDKDLPTIILSNGLRYYILNYNSLLNNNEYRENLTDGNFYHISKITAKQLSTLKVPSQEYKYSLPYDSKGITDKYLEVYKNNYKGEISSNVKNYNSILRDLTFGLEFETTKGFIPNRILNNYGLIPLRDGSISGIEYVTVPLAGDKGLQTVIDMLDSLKERTEFDNTCSLHLHLGNVPRTKEFILAFFLLTCSIQEEMFSYFPIFKKYNFRIKNKNYSAPYPLYKLLSKMDSVIDSNNIDSNFNVLYQFLSEGQSFEEVGCDLRYVKAHPRDPEGTQKWLIHTRYFFNNLIPLIFGNKTTVEFRIHTPTYEANKIIPFILLNSMLVNFVIDNEKSILGNKTFLDNLNIYRLISNQCNNLKDGGTLESAMVDYLEIRKKTTESQNANGIIQGDESKVRRSNYINWNSKEDVLTGLSFSKPKIVQHKSKSVNTRNKEQLEKYLKDISSFGYTATLNKETFPNLQEEVNVRLEDLTVG